MIIYLIEHFFACILIKKECILKADIEKAIASKHESYGTFTIISILLPFIGIILGIVYLTKDNKLDKKLGEHCLALGVLFSILAAGVYQFWLVDSGSSPTIDITNTYNQTTSTQQQPEVNLKETIMLSGTTVIRQQGDYLQVLGEATNNGNKTVTMTLKTTFYDADNKIIGTAMGTVSDLAPTKVETFTLYSTVPITNYKTHKTQVDTIF